MSKLLPISSAAEFLGVSPKTLRRWESRGLLSPQSRTIGNQRRYALEDLEALKNGSPLTVSPVALSPSKGHPAPAPRSFSVVGPAQRSPLGEVGFSQLLILLIVGLLVAAGAYASLQYYPREISGAVSSLTRALVSATGVLKIDQEGKWVRTLATLFFGESDNYYVNQTGDAAFRSLTTSSLTTNQLITKSLTTDYLTVTRSETIAGLNAEFLSSFSSSQFLRSDTSTSFTQGTLTFAPGTTLNVSSGSFTLANLQIPYSKLNLGGSIVGSDLSPSISITTSGNLSSTGTISSSSSIFTTGGGTITSSGLLTAGNGFTLSAGTLTLPAGSIADSFLSSNVALLNNTQTVTGAKTFTQPITAPTSTNTINSLIVNAGSLSGITGYSQSSGNFAITGTGTFSTGTGAISLNGATTLANSLSLGGNLTFSADNTYDIGASGANRPRTGYFGTTLVLGTNPSSTGAIRLPNGTSGQILARNNANNGDRNLIFLNTSDQTVIGDNSAHDFLLNSTSGVVLFNTDNAIDIGASGANRARDLYIARDIYAAHELVLGGSSAVTNEFIYLPETVTENQVDSHAAYFAPTMGSANAGSNGDLVGARIVTAASAFTMARGAGFWVQQPLIGAGSSVTDAMGLRVRNQGASGITNAYGVYVEGFSGASTRHAPFYYETGPVAIWGSGAMSIGNSTDPGVGNLSLGTNPSSTGTIRLPYGSIIGTRNNLNNNDGGLFYGTISTLSGGSKTNQWGFRRFTSSAISTIAMDPGDNGTGVGQEIDADANGAYLRMYDSGSILQFQVGVAGGVVGGGVTVGNATGGLKGTGTINIAGDIYKNGTAYTNPDYVLEDYYTGSITKFANNYGASTYPGFMNLGDVENYAKANYELPRVASASGIFQRGDILLEKMEEAYLYLFDHEHRIKALENTLSSSPTSTSTTTTSTYPTDPTFNSVTFGAIKLTIDANGALNVNGSMVAGKTTVSDLTANNGIFGTISSTISATLESLTAKTAEITSAVFEKITTKLARVNELEMVDKATGETYCTWIENGEWQKNKGVCAP